MKIKTSMVGLIFFALLTVLILIILGASSYWKVARVALDYNNLLEENKRLNEGLTRMEEMAEDLEKLKKIDQKLRASLSGYISLNNASSQGGDALEKMDELSFTSLDRSIFNSIPELYPVDGFLTRGYERESLVGDAHFGVDIAGAKGSPVKATADGIVIFAGWTYEEGYVIILKHQLDYYSFYKHNLRNLCQEWESVKKGQVIALLGDTGQISSGPHLHFEIWKDTKPVDPIKYLRKN